MPRFDGGTVAASVNLPDEYRKCIPAGKSSFCHETMSRCGHWANIRTFGHPLVITVLIGGVVSDLVTAPLGSHRLELEEGACIPNLGRWCAPSFFSHSSVWHCFSTLHLVEWREVTLEFHLLFAGLQLHVTVCDA